MTSPGKEQFGAIPVRAFGDGQLSANDFRLLGTIAYFDRFGRNGYGCTVDLRRLAQLASIQYSHLARHAKRLKDRGYLNIGRSPTDGRKRAYSVIYEDQIAAAAESDREAKLGSEPLGDIATVGDFRSDIVARPNPQVADRKAESRSKRSCKTDLKDPAKQGVELRENRMRDLPHKPTNYARQENHAASGSQTQGQTRPLPCGFRELAQSRANQASPHDWDGWAKWLGEIPKIDNPWMFISDLSDRIKSSLGVSRDAADKILDRCLRKARATWPSATPIEALIEKSIDRHKRST